MTLLITLGFAGVAVFAWSLAVVLVDDPAPTRRDKHRPKEVEAKDAEIALLRAVLGVFADYDAWGTPDAMGHRLFWSPTLKEHPAKFARAALEGK
jgi:hypothetical protein